MFKQMLQPLPYQTKKVINSIGDGVNSFDSKGFEISESEATYIRNMSSLDYPALSVRDGRATVFDSITTPVFIGQRNNSRPHILDGTVWKRWNGTNWSDIKTGLTNSWGKFIEFNTGTDKFTILATDDDLVSYDGSTTNTLSIVYDTRLAAGHKGRLYLLKENELRFSALNIIDDFTTADDAGLIIITNAKGKGTALTEYADHIIAFTEFSMHELYGTGPQNYQLVDVEGAKGCISDKSVVQLNGALYYAWYDGIYRYAGGKPQKISDKVDAYFDGLNKTYKNKIVGWYNESSLYMSIPYNGASTNNITIEYDTKIDRWYIHDYGVLDAVNIEDKTYLLNSSGIVQQLNSGTTDSGEAISWQWISKVFNDGAISQKKIIYNMWVVLDLPSGSSCSLYASDSVDDDDFELLHTFTPNASEQNQKVMIPTSKFQNIDWYRLKLTGSGPCTIYYIEKEIRILPR